MSQIARWNVQPEGQRWRGVARLGTVMWTKVHESNAAATSWAQSAAEEMNALRAIGDSRVEEYKGLNSSGGYA